MKLSELLKDLELKNLRCQADFDIKGVSCDSKRVACDHLFVAIKGDNCDGRDFIAEAVGRGARFIVLEAFNPTLMKFIELNKSLGYAEVPDSRLALAKLADKFYGHPSEKIKVIGITGTNGKTTTSYLIESMLKKAGFKVGRLGTIEYRFEERAIPAWHTTPDACQLQYYLSQMVKEGLDYCIMEVSSHALQQHRTKFVEFNQAIFTNLSQDHLDYHINMENYFSAKAKLFEGLSPGSKAIINLDDAYAKELIQRSPVPVVTYGLESYASLRAHRIHLSLEASEFEVSMPGGKLRLCSRLIGRHNIYNILAAIACGLQENLEPEVIKGGIEALHFVPGRLENVSPSERFSVFVDYAHTEDALRSVLETIRAVSPKKVILVFGCGGDRDKSKRKKMGKVASKLADFVIITSDNPRSEDPQRIAQDITKGLNSGQRNFKVIIDRLGAIKEAISMADSDSIVLVAGKGHERHQIFRDFIMPFDDREVTQCLLSEISSMLPVGN
jgi:UDP-N-acetylmuramoyl-L-alanyl-D-glutamate--2,6-diaminopimelate ligase